MGVGEEGDFALEGVEVREGILHCIGGRGGRGRVDDDKMVEDPLDEMLRSILVLLYSKQKGVGSCKADGLVSVLDENDWQY
jgi:hypothetical protein